MASASDVHPGLKFKEEKENPNKASTEVNQADIASHFLIQHMQFV